jgi:putative addiction module component
MVLPRFQLRDQVVLPAPSEVARVKETTAVPGPELENNSALPLAQSCNRCMGRDATEILKEALALPAETRAALAGSLLDGLDPEIDEDAEAAWQRKIRPRVSELDSKVISPVPRTEVTTTAPGWRWRPYGAMSTTGGGSFGGSAPDGIVCCPALRNRAHLETGPRLNRSMAAGELHCVACTRAVLDTLNGIGIDGCFHQVAS